MELYFHDNAVPSNNIVISGWYAIKCEDGWLRARVVDINSTQNTVVCFLVDTGDEETHKLGSLYDLPHQFLNVAPQVCTFTYFFFLVYVFFFFIDFYVYFRLFFAV